MKFLKIIRLQIFLLVVSLTANAQSVWPGDINNNGIVNNVDYLYWGYANEMMGPPRLPGEQGIDFEAKNVDTPWGVNLPGVDIDAGFADCNGNGFIGDFEDQEAIVENYGKTHDIVNPDDIVVGTLGVDPPLFFESDFQDYFIEGTVGALYIQLGTSDQLIDYFQGIAFTIRYDPDVIGDEFVGVAFSDFPWVSDIPLMLSINDSDSGTIEVAVSRLSPEPIQDAFGTIGTLFFIIEDDVVSMDEQELETTFYIEKITMFDSDFNIAPVTSDSIVVSIVRDPLAIEDPNESNKIDVYPNPVEDQLHIESPYFIEELEIYNPIGQQILRKSYPNENSIFIQLENPPSGIYFVKIKTQKGIITRKIIINSNNN